MAETKIAKKTLKTASSSGRATKPRTKKAVAAVSKKPVSKLGSGFAVFETGGKQYKVSSGDALLVEKLSDTHKKGDSIVFDKVLLQVNDGKVVVGAPYIAGATVHATFEEAVRGKKINVLKFKSKSRYAKRYGHRQPYSKIKIL